MEKLIYYAATSPEKLDRIGEYLNHRIERYLYRSRFGFVKIGMEAMDQLLKACPSQWLNLYIEFYLKTVQRLLESPEPEMWRQRLLCVRVRFLIKRNSKVICNLYFVNLLPVMVTTA